MRNHRARAVLLAGVLAVAASGCGDDDSNGDDNAPDQPLLTNEMGVETFEPGDDTFDLPPTVEPEDNS